MLVLDFGEQGSHGSELHRCISELNQRVLHIVVFKCLHRKNSKILNTKLIFSQFAQQNITVFADLSTGKEVFLPFLHRKSSKILHT